MKRLLRRKSYNAGRRPSGHKISATGFLTDHGGAISANVLDFEHEASTPASLLKFTGTAWDADYRAYCAANDLPAHPARMQAGLVSFFINFLTNKGDLIFDPFGGSNTTGAVAEQLKRRWITVEAEPKYVAGSKGRFAEYRRGDSDLDQEGADIGE
jgi:DNA modification methylase